MTVAMTCLLGKAHNAHCVCNRPVVHQMAKSSSTAGATSKLVKNVVYSCQAVKCDATVVNIYVTMFMTMYFIFHFLSLPLVHCNGNISTDNHYLRYQSRRL